jgi:hypothetical protein
MAALPTICLTLALALFFAGCASLAVSEPDQAEPVDADAVPIAAELALTRTTATLNYEIYGLVVDQSGTQEELIRVTTMPKKLIGSPVRVQATLTWNAVGSLRACLSDHDKVVPDVPCAEAPSPLVLAWSDATGGAAPLPNGCYDVALFSPGGPQIVARLVMESEAAVRDNSAEAI